MEGQKKQAIIELLEIVNNLDMSSILILNSGANMLKAKENLDRKGVSDMAQNPKEYKAG